MSTALIRRCDQCREEVPLGQPLYVVTADLVAMPLARHVRFDTPRDVCGEACYLSLLRNLFREAARDALSAPAMTACGAG